MTIQEIEIQAPKNLELYPFQVDGVQFILSCFDKYRGSYLGDEPGLGKTVQTLCVRNTLRARKTLIVCPSSVKGVWLRETRKWSILTPTSIGVIHTHRDVLTVDSADIVIVSYRMLLNMSVLKMVARHKWDLAILDEAHAIKNPQAKTTREIIQKVLSPERVKKFVYLSGTALTRCTTDIYVHGRSILITDPDFGSFNAFASKYAKRVYNPHSGGVIYKGGKNLPELREKLASTFFLRRRKEDVLDDLPDKIYQIIDITISYDDKTRPTFPSEANLTAEIIKLGEEPKGLAEQRSQLGVLKAVPSLEFILQEFVEQDVPVVVFAHHRDVIRLMYQAFSSKNIPVSMITGETSPRDRDTQVQRFQAGVTKVFLGSIHAAGEGITLTAASHVVFVEHDWSPAKMEQAADRCHRIGQKDCVNIYYMCSQDPLDKRVIDVLIEKQKMIRGALG